MNVIAILLFLLWTDSLLLMEEVLQFYYDCFLIIGYEQRTKNWDDRLTYCKEGLYEFLVWEGGDFLWGIFGGIFFRFLLITVFKGSKSSCLKDQTTNL